jgi:hypothetical protein
MNPHAFHAIFSRNGIKMLPDYLSGSSILSIDLPGIHGCSEVEFPLENIFKSFSIISHRKKTDDQKHSG